MPGPAHEVSVAHGRQLQVGDASIGEQVSVQQGVRGARGRCQP